MLKVLILGGGGDTGRRLSERLSSDDVVVSITSRSPEKVGWAAESGVSTIHWDPSEADFAESVHHSPDVVVNLIGAWLVGAEAALVDATRAVLEALEPGTRYIHCSAISVWGSRPGESVDEDDPVFADQRVAQLHLEAESIVDEHVQRGVDAVVLRLPHIYGPGRERTINLMRDGRFVILGDGQNRMHHLHVEDFVEVLRNVALRDRLPSRLYAVVDDDDSTYGAYCDLVTALTGTIPLPLMSLSDALRGELANILGPHFKAREVVAEFWRFMTSDLRVRNDRMKSELGIRLRYPTFREGLPGVIDAELAHTEKSEMTLEENFRSWSTEILARDEVRALELEHERMERVAEDARIHVIPFESDHIRWGRLAFLSSKRMLNLNCVVFPRVGVAAPVLGIEIVATPEGATSFAALDLWGSDSDFGELLAAAKDSSLSDHLLPIEGRLTSLLSPDAVAVGGAAPIEVVLRVSHELLHRYLERVAASAERPGETGAREQRDVCRRLLERPGAVDLMAAMFGREWATNFLSEVYYPEPG